MAKVKGTDVVSLRKVFKKLDSSIEAEFLAQLSLPVETIYTITTVHSWIPGELLCEIYQAAASVLYPNEDFALRKLGQVICQYSYSSIYKLFLRIPTVPFVLNSAARIWRTYNDEGSLRIERTSSTGILLSVVQYSSWFMVLQDVAEGHFVVLMQFAGAKNVQLLKQPSSPDCWQWQIIWE
jgi:hypothetical protein